MHVSAQHIAAGMLQESVTEVDINMHAIIKPYYNVNAGNFKHKILEATLVNFEFLQDN